jgi:branched-chain amino acid transport system substrate-binding protein
LKTAFDRDHLAPQLQVEFDAAGAQWEEIAGRVAGHTGPVVVIASATASARLITAIRGRGFRGIVLAGPWIARAPRTAELAGVLYPLPGEASAEFRARFHARFGAKPDYAAAHAYDAVSIAVAAIRKAGLNRARIREAVMELSPYAGVTGRIEWDAMGQNRRAPLLREIAVP